RGRPRAGGPAVADGSREPCHSEPRRRRGIPPAHRCGRSLAPLGMTLTTMHVAICGGTFDPFHRGHLEPVLAARETMAWDRILYMPAGRQPFKVHRDTASGYHRFAM